MIYIIEDDDSIRELMIYTLNMAGYEAEGFPDSRPFWENMKSRMADLILLDIMLPEEDGITILKKLRSSPITSDIPVILTTAKGTEYDKVTGLDLGADDYLAKPYGMMEMISRVKAVLRRSKPKTAPSVLCQGYITIDQSRHIVYADSKAISLTLKEYDLLKFLMENSGQCFSRDQLFYHVWGSDYAGETRTVDVHVGTLRTKLGKYGQQIKTVRGVGYKFEAEAEQ